MTIRTEILDEYEDVKQLFHYDFATGVTTIETIQRVDGLLDANRKLADDEERTRRGIKDEMWHYASIPIVVQEQWLREYGHANWPMLPGNEKLLLRLLNSPEWKYLKTTNGLHT